MLGARTVHEWAHLAVDAGWVPRVVGEPEFAARQARFGGARSTSRRLPRCRPRFRSAHGADLAELGRRRASPAAWPRQALPRAHAPTIRPTCWRSAFSIAPRSRPTCATTSARCALSTRRRSSSDAGPVPLSSISTSVSARSPTRGRSSCAAPGSTPTSSRPASSTPRASSALAAAAARDLRVLRGRRVALQRSDALMVSATTMRKRFRSALS